MLVSYRSKKNKVVTLLSSLHDQNVINETKKKKTWGHNNEKKAGMDDKHNQILRNCTVRTKIRWWQMVVFSNIVDISALNPFIV